MTKEVIQITDVNFEEEVLKSHIPVMVDFWAEWCMPCKAIAPLVDEIARDYKDKVKVAKINVDDNSHIAAEFNIMNIPAVIFFKSGKEYKRIIGANPRRVYEKVIKELLGG